MTRSMVEKIKNYQKENGTRQLLLSALKKLKNAFFFYNREIVGCISVTDLAFCAHPKIPVTIRAAELSDIPELKILTEGYKRRDFSQWIHDRYIFYIAQLQNTAERKDIPSVSKKKELKNRSSSQNPSSGDTQTPPFDKNIVGYICICPSNKSKHTLISILKLKETDYWAVDAYIHPPYRGKGINAAIASTLLAHAKREGYRRGYGTILFKNNASRRSYSFIGEKEIGLFTSITIGGVTFHFLRRNKGYEEYFN
jgi:GNAT superfamily N-acetyltransferase